MNAAFSRRAAAVLTPILFGAAFLLIVGIGALLTGRGSASTNGLNQENPVAADTRSLQSGKAIFGTSCAQCHGDGGHGDGPRAASLNPKPLDLTVHVGLHPDGQLYDWISNGIARTAMPAWKGELSVSQRWDVLNYLRTLAPSGEDSTVGSR